ncbi:MAG: shikimate dehydrogenase [Fibrobacterota bacterium]
MKKQNIRGTTRITGLLGNPVGHSISPQIHNHIFAHFNHDYVYIPLGVGEQDLKGLLNSLRALNFAGANVTIPFKTAVIPFCDTLSPLSKLTGTVNTLVYSDGSLHGTTTDGAGFLRALRSDGFEPAGKSVCILGNGGTARTIAMVLAHEGLPADLTLLGRNQQKVDTLAREVREKTGMHVRGGLLENAQSICPESDLVVNCTPLGMAPHSDKTPLADVSLSRDTYLFDAVYNPLQSRFLREGRARGCAGQNGLFMLLFQGLESSRYWTGQGVSADIFQKHELEEMVGA